MSPIERAIEACGTQLELAKRLGIAAPTVSQWRNGVRPIPAHHCRAIEVATQGQVTRYDLRPDVFGPPPSNEPSGEASNEQRAEAA